MNHRATIRSVLFLLLFTFVLLLVFSLRATAQTYVMSTTTVTTCSGTFTDPGRCRRLSPGQYQHDDHQPRIGRVCLGQLHVL